MTEQTEAIRQFSSERFKAFVDAVVAIAMTLLILPLMESVSEAATQELNTLEFLDEHSGQLMSFALSFVLIANFWIGHHRLYHAVDVVTRPLLWINVAWMATIVWLPVATAMLGQMESDPLQAVLYIGTLSVTQLLSFAGRMYLLGHPDFTSADPMRIRQGAAADLCAAVLFGIALLVTVFVGSVGYFSLFLLMFTGPAAKLIMRVTGWGGEASQPE